MTNLNPIGANEKVYLHNTYFLDTKRHDGQISAVLLIDRTKGRRRVKDSVELVAESRDALDVAIAGWADRHAENLSELESIVAEPTQ